MVLSAAAIPLLLFGLRNLQTWGPVVADSGAPFSLLRLSPAPLLIHVGIVLGQAFFAWSSGRVAAGGQPLAFEVLAVGLIGVLLTSAVVRSELPSGLHARVAPADVDFVTADEVRSKLHTTSATPDQVREAVALNQDSQLRTLRASFLNLGAISLLAIPPAARLPRYVPGERPAEDLSSEASGGVAEQ